MVGKEVWQQYSQKIQNRIFQSDVIQLQDIKNTKALHRIFLNVLNKACDDGTLKTSMHELRGLLKMTPPSDGKVELTGGVRNFKRSHEMPHFSRHDGCWFDFAIMIDENSTPSEIIAFNFEIRFPDSVPVQYIRYDLNIPDHNNESHGLRFHIHPGCDDFRLHSPPISPLEILYLFLYDFKIPRKLRQI